MTLYNAHYTRCLCCILISAGGGSKEQLPMVFKVPRLSKSALSVCLRPYSLLGFGDILVPGEYNVTSESL